MFDLNFGLFVWTTLVFLALLAILWRFAWGPVLSAVEEREKRIQGTLDQAAQERTEAARILAEHMEQMADARRKAQQLIAEGREGGERLRQEIEEKARAEGQALIERARDAIEREKEAAIEALRRESVDIAIAAAARVMQEKLDSEKDRALVMGYIEELGSSDEGARA
jgi:F-type H+-transporting ATPase subunit b